MAKDVGCGDGIADCSLPISGVASNRNRIVADNEPQNKAPGLILKEQDKPKGGNVMEILLKDKSITGITVDGSAFEK